MGDDSKFSESQDVFGSTASGVSSDDLRKGWLMRRFIASIYKLVIANTSSTEAELSYYYFIIASSENDCMIYRSIFDFQKQYTRIRSTKQ